MEPQYNKDTGSYTFGETKKKSSKAGCFIIAGIILLAILSVGGYFIYKAIFKIKSVTEKLPNSFDLKPNPTQQKSKDDRFNGSFIDALVVPDKDGKPLLWILTDGSTKYFKKITAPGYSSMGVACTDCKSLAYIFDPEGGKVIKQTENKFNGVITDPHIVFYNGKIIQSTMSSNDDGPNIITYDAYSGDVIKDTKSFLNDHNELQAGVKQVYSHPEDKIIKMDTKDGRRDLIYSIVKDKFYSNEIEFKKDIASDAEDGNGSLFTLKGDYKDLRKQLWKITASNKNIILRGAAYFSYLGSTAFTSFYGNEAEAKPIEGKKYLQGIIYYQDNDCLVIIYLDQDDKTANRIMTCLDSKTCEEKWTVQQNELFDLMTIDESARPSRTLSNTKDYIKVRRSNNIITLIFKDEGVMGFDLQTGKKLWTIDIG